MIIIIRQCFLASKCFSRKEKGRKTSSPSNLRAKSMLHNIICRMLAVECSAHLHSTFFLLAFVPTFLATSLFSKNNMIFKLSLPLCEWKRGHFHLFRKQAISSRSPDPAKWLGGACEVSRRSLSLFFSSFTWEEKIFIAIGKTNLWLLFHLAVLLPIVETKEKSDDEKGGENEKMSQWNPNHHSWDSFKLCISIAVFVFVFVFVFALIVTIPHLTVSRDVIPSIAI